jgi:hypothetical protein
MIPKKLALGLDPRVEPGFRKRSCAKQDPGNYDSPGSFSTNAGLPGLPGLRLSGINLS